MITVTPDRMKPGIGMMTILVVGALVLLMGGCSKKGTGGDEDPVNVAGMWYFYDRDTPIDYELTVLDIVQSGNGLQLDFDACDPGYLTGGGNIHGRTLSLSVAVAETDTVVMTGIAEGDSLHGEWRRGTEIGDWIAKRTNINDACIEVTVPIRSIAVDGGISDWSGEAAAIEDQPGDGDTSTDGSDLSALYLGKDRDDVYIRLDTHDGPPDEALYIGVTFYPHNFSEEGDRFVFINVSDRTCSVEERTGETGSHTFVASGSVAMQGSVIEASVPLASLLPPERSHVRVWNDVNGQSVDRIRRIIAMFDAGAYPSDTISASLVEIADGTVYVGTSVGLAISSDWGETWDFKTEEDGLGAGGVSSIMAIGQEIWIATATTRTAEETEIPTGTGVSYSFDGGETWNHMSGPNTCDYCAIYDFARDGQYTWAAGFVAGLVRIPLGSYDESDWEVITPDTASFDPIGNMNHLASSAIVHEQIIWVGTAAGVNRSTDGGQSWSNISHGGGARSIDDNNRLCGDFVVALFGEPGSSGVWAACQQVSAVQSHCVGVTRDSGSTWQNSLYGFRIWNFDSQGGRVFAAGEPGLLVTDNDGDSWSDFASTGGFPPGEIFDVALHDNNIWIAGDAGLFLSRDAGATWERIYLD